MCGAAWDIIHGLAASLFFIRTGDEMLSLLGVPRHVCYRRPVAISELTPWLLLLQIPDDG